MATKGQRQGLYENGLRFECTGCGNCCSCDPGTVAVNDAEIDAISRYLSVPRDQFVKKYLYRIPKGYSIRERANYDCFFFSNGKCNIYEVRPTQCRTWPFWKSNLRTERDWAETAEQCPGIGKGKLHSKKDILARISERS